MKTFKDYYSINGAVINRRHPRALYSNECAWVERYEVIESDGQVHRTEMYSTNQLWEEDGIPVTKTVELTGFEFRFNKGDIIRVAEYSTNWVIVFVENISTKVYITSRISNSRLWLSDFFKTFNVKVKLLPEQPLAEVNEAVEYKILDESVINELISDSTFMDVLKRLQGYPQLGIGYNSKEVSLLGISFYNPGTQPLVDALQEYLRDRGYSPVVSTHGSNSSYYQLTRGWNSVDGGRIRLYIL